MIEGSRGVRWAVRPSLRLGGVWKMPSEMKKDAKVVRSTGKA